MGSKTSPGHGSIVLATVRRTISPTTPNSEQHKSAMTYLRKDWIDDFLCIHYINIITCISCNNEYICTVSVKHNYHVRTTFSDGRPSCIVV